MTFIAKAIRKVQRESYKAIYPSREATADFNEYVGRYHEDKVIGDSCNSWLKSGKGKSRPLVGWPGTGHHRISICREPRWEDFVLERSERGKRNRYEYFGNGWTQREEEADPVALTSYLHAVGTVDLATLHETWNE